MFRGWSVGSDAGASGGRQRRDGAKGAGEDRVIKGMGCLARESDCVLALLRRLYGIFSSGEGMLRLMLERPLCRITYPW